MTANEKQVAELWDRFAAAKNRALTTNAPEDREEEKKAYSMWAAAYTGHTATIIPFPVRAR